MTLAHLQADFQRQLLEGNSSFADRVAPPPTGSVAQRIAIYADAYRIRLRDSLASNYPRLQRYVGADAFQELADVYIDANPSTYRSLRWFGEALPALLRMRAPDAPWIAELAEWEWALAGAFDAADAASITVDALSSVPATEWPTLRLALHPSVRCLRLCTNAVQIFKALASETEAPRPCATADTYWLISRFDLEPRYRSMSASEWQALNTMREGGSFETMCTTLAAFDDPDETAMNAARLLRTWIDEALVCKVVRAAAPR